MSLTIDLPPDLETKLETEARKRGVTASEFLRTVVENLLEQSDGPEEPEQVAVHPLVRLAEKAREGIPPEAWKDQPTDGAKNYKHYLYGHPKVDV